MTKADWQGIAPKEIERLAIWADEHGHGPFHVDFALAIDRLLKEKNLCSDINQSDSAEPKAWKHFDEAYQKACFSSQPQDWIDAALLARQVRNTHPQPKIEPVTIEMTTMELAESVGLIGPASRSDDLHEAIQRFYDLICVNATVKAAQMAASAIQESTHPPQRSEEPQPKRDRATPREWAGLTGQQKNLIARISVDVFDAIHRTDTKLKELNT